MDRGKLRERGEQGLSLRGKIKAIAIVFIGGVWQEKCLLTCLFVYSVIHSLIHSFHHHQWDFSMNNFSWRNSICTFLSKCPRGQIILTVCSTLQCALQSTRAVGSIWTSFYFLSPSTPNEKMINGSGISLWVLRVRPESIFHRPWSPSTLQVK